MLCIENIPDTVTDMTGTFRSTGLTEVPELPAKVKVLEYAFSNCRGITKVDFSKLPSSSYSFQGAFLGTSVTEVKITFADMDKKESSTLDFAFCFCQCSLLKTVVIDCTNLTTDKKLWLQAICQDCTVLESFELINFPETDIMTMPGSECCAGMFRNCENLVSVKNEGYFCFSGETIFQNCKKLKTIETKGFVGIFPSEGLEAAFQNCEVLEGTYYIQLLKVSDIYDGFYRNNSLEKIKEKLKYTFKGCSDKVTFYVGCKPLVD